jgi:hypothetical protein
MTCLEESQQRFEKLKIALASEQKALVVPADYAMFLLTVIDRLEGEVVQMNEVIRNQTGLTWDEMNQQNQSIVRND